MDIDKANISSRSSMHKLEAMPNHFKSYGKCLRTGPIARNPYLNFLREFRKRNVGLSAVETVRRGAAEWRSLPKDQKLQFIEAAFYAPKKRKPMKRMHQMQQGPVVVTTAPVSMPISPIEGCCPQPKCPRRRKKKKKKASCGKKKRKRVKKRSTCKKRRRRRKRC